MNSVRHFLLALQFFTRVPVTGRLAAWWASALPCCVRARRIFRAWDGWWAR